MSIKKKTYIRLFTPILTIINAPKKFYLLIYFRYHKNKQINALEQKLYRAVFFLNAGHKNQFFFDNAK